MVISKNGCDRPVLREFKDESWDEITALLVKDFPFNNETDKCEMMEFIEYVRANFMQITSPLRDGMIIYVLTTTKAGTRCN
jgi:hypothetical protein